MESEILEVNDSDDIGNQNSPLKKEVLLPTEVVGEVDTSTNNPPSGEEAQENNTDSEIVVLKHTKCKIELDETGSEELVQAVPIIVEDNPTVREGLKSCLRSKTMKNCKETPSENSNEILNIAAPLQEGDKCHGIKKKKGRKVRFYLKRKANTNPPESLSKTPCADKLKTKKVVVNHKPQGNGDLSRKKFQGISAANSPKQKRNVNNASNRRKHKVCVTKPAISESHTAVFVNKLEETVANELEVPKAHIDSENQSSQDDNELVEKEYRNGRNVHARELVASNSSNGLDNKKENKQSSIEKLDMVNTVPNSSLSTALVHEVQTKSKFTKKVKHNVNANRPKQNVILRKSLLTDACANISAAFAQNPADKWALPNKDIKLGVSSQQEHESIATLNSSESLSLSPLRQGEPEVGGQVLEIGIDVSLPSKQKQATKITSPKKSGSESTSLEMSVLDTTSEKKATVQFKEVSGDSSDIQISPLKRSTENKVTKSITKLPLSPNGEQAVVKSVCINSDVGVAKTQRFGFLQCGQSQDSDMNLGLFNTNRSLSHNYEGNIYEDFGSLAQKLKKFRKWPVPDGISQQSEAEKDNFGEVSFHAPESSGDVKDIAEPGSSENTEVSSHGSGTEPDISLSPASTSTRKVKSRKERKCSKNDIRKLNESAVCGEQNSNEIMPSSASFNTSLMPSQSELIYDSDPKLKEGVGTTLSGELNVKSNLKHKQESIKKSIPHLSEISKDIPKISIALDKKKTDLCSDKSSQKIIEYLDLAGAERKQKHRLITLTPQAVESFAEKISCKKSAVKIGMNVPGLKNTEISGSIEPSKIQVENTANNPASPRKGKKGVKSLNTDKQKEVQFSCAQPTTTMNTNSVLASKERSGTLKNHTCPTTKVMEEKVSKLSLSMRMKEVQAINENVAPIVSTKHSPHSAKIKRKIETCRLDPCVVSKKKAFKPSPDSAPAVTSEHEPLPASPIINKPHVKKIYRKLLRRYSIKNCFVKLEKLTSDDIIKNSSLALERYYKMCAERSFSPHTTLKRSPQTSPRKSLSPKTTPKRSPHPLHRKSLLPKISPKRSPQTSPRKNISIAPENIPKLQKVMEDVLSSDDECWLGWNSLITELDEFTLVSVCEDSIVTHTLVSKEPPVYPAVKFCDKSTDTSDLEQLKDL